MDGLGVTELPGIGLALFALSIVANGDCAAERLLAFGVVVRDGAAERLLAFGVDVRDGALIGVDDVCAFSW